MKFKINYSIGNHEDSYILEADTIEEIIELNIEEMLKRNLNKEKNNCWSIEL
jgi:hypothetical protein